LMSMMGLMSRIIARYAHPPYPLRGGEGGRGSRARAKAPGELWRV